MLSLHVKFVQKDRQTDRQTDGPTDNSKTICPRSFDAGLILEKLHFELSLLIVWIALWIVKTYSEFQVIIFSNNRDITK